MGRIKKYVLTASSIILFGLLAAAGMPEKVKADENVYPIETEADLWEYAEKVNNKDSLSGVTLRLMNDITLTYEGHEGEALTIGKQDAPFSGIFDGNGHSISGLKYKEIATVPRADTALFGVTEGAEIRDLVLKNAEIESDIRGGILAGYVKNTKITGVTVTDSSLSVAAADNVLLIGTDLGIRGGGIAGEANNSVLYDCEVNNCWIRSNNTSGVAALAGKPLSLGGIAGCAEATTIEYCRVTGGDPYDSKTPDDTSDKTRISIYYDVAVGALGGNTLYVGGIAGRIWSGDDDDNKDKGTKVIDSFSTADMYFYCATYVSVIGINIGHIGGVTAEVWDENCEITRCHYAGKASSEQWNPLLVIPIIEKNVNIDGIADIFDGDKGKVYGTFFKPSVNPDVEMGTMGSDASTGNTGPWADSLYVNREAWEQFGYDFSGTEARESEYSKSHYNKWVMDHELGIPVHGSSVAATFDFPGAGEVSVSGTDLIGQQVSTADPYTFAVQGAAASDDSLTLTYTPSAAGYRLDGWWRIPDVTERTATQSHSYFTGLYDRYGTIADVPVLGRDETSVVTNPVSGEDTYLPVNTEGETVQWEDNDLFVARIKALVRFHDITGAQIDRESGSQDEDSDDDWYDHEEALPHVTPQKEPDSESASLIGWTTDQSYEAITSAELEALKQSGEFYEPGDPVGGPLDLYPVYADLISNITTVFEGHDKDGVEDSSRREGVGYTSSRMSDDGRTAVISVAGTKDEGAFPDGYRFLGWYDESGYRVSTQQEYALDGVDLTEEHEYTARFEYRVDYYEWCQYHNSYNQSDYKESGIYAQIWHLYGKEFQSIPGLNFYKEEFRYWSGDGHEGSTVFSGPIYQPEKVYSVNEKTGGLDQHLYDVDVLIDFPGAGKVEMETATLNDARVNFSATANDGYFFRGWSWESRKTGLGSVKESGDSESEGADISVASTNQYVYMGHFTARVVFHHLSEGQETSVETERRYEQKVFDGTGSYTYPYYVNDSENTNVSYSYTGAPSDEDMIRDGYYFLGWVDKKALGDKWSSIYDVDGDYCCTTSIAKAAPYVLSKDTLTYGPMDLYPVYAKYDYTFTTNLKESGFMGNETFNAPAMPQCIESGFAEKGDGTAEVTFTVDTQTPIEKETTKPLYRVTSVECVNLTAGSQSRTVLDGNTDGTYTGTIRAGYSYQFIANYNPAAILYHLGGATVEEDEIETEMVDIGQRLGESPQPRNTEEALGTDALFAGWTQTKPESGHFHIAAPDGIPELVSENTPVTAPMELWPVYVSPGIGVDSNIDGITGSTGHRGYRTGDPYEQAVTLWAQEEVTSSGRIYAFTGWYTEYDHSDSESGQILSTQSEYRLSGSAVFDDQTYTAVYKEMYMVRYHDTEGRVIYTAYVNDRSFVYETDVPNPDYDPDQAVSGDNQETVKVEVPYDAEAFTAVMEQMPDNEIFKEWQWVKGDVATAWKDFCGETVTENMDLYPVTYEAEVSDSSGNPMTSAGDGRAIDLGFEASQDEAGETSAQVTVLLRKEYTEKFLMVTLSEKAYRDGGADTKEMGVQPVSLYLCDKPPGNNDISYHLYEKKDTDENGEARFDLYGTLVITKEQAEMELKKSDGEFLFTVKDTEGNLLLTVPVKAGETKTIREVPYGQYVVEESDNWAWRYTGAYMAGGSVSPDGNVRVSNYSDSGEFVCTNTLTDSRWFDHSTGNKNVFRSDGTD